jgi:hypothetical protein
VPIAKDSPANAEDHRSMALYEHGKCNVVTAIGKAFQQPPIGKLCNDAILKEILKLSAYRSCTFLRHP